MNWFLPAKATPIANALHKHIGDRSGSLQRPRTSR